MFAKFAVLITIEELPSLETEAGISRKQPAVSESIDCSNVW